MSKKRRQFAVFSKSALPNPGSHYGPYKEGFLGTEQNRAVKGAVFSHAPRPTTPHIIHLTETFTLRDLTTGKNISQAPKTILLPRRMFFSASRQAEQKSLYLFRGRQTIKDY